MLDNIGQTAVRTLGIDVANLSTRLAVHQAILEEILRVASSFDTISWKHEPIQTDNGPVGFVVTLPGEESEKLEELLRILRQLHTVV